MQYIILSLFIYFERDRERVQAGEGQKGGAVQRIRSRLYAHSKEPDTGFEPTNREIMT